MIWITTSDQRTVFMFTNLGLTNALLIILMLLSVKTGPYLIDMLCEIRDILNDVKAELQIVAKLSKK